MHLLAAPVVGVRYTEEMALTEEAEEEVLEAEVSSEEKGEDEDELCLAQYLPMIKRRKQSDTEKRVLRKKKNHSALVHQTKKQVISKVRGESTSHQRKKATVVHSSEARGESTRNKRKRAVVDYSSPVLERAEEIQANLAAEFPSFVKTMLPSHVTGGFWLGLSKQFCNLHMPKTDTNIILEDESGEEYETRYLSEKVGLSGGWRSFSMAHKLVQGDVLIFHLVKPSKFKVYVVRFNSLDEVDGALGLLNLDAFTRKMDIDDTEMPEESNEKCLELLPPETCGDHIQTDIQMPVDFKFQPLSDLSENDSNNLDSEVFESIQFSDSVVSLKEVSSFEDFTIVVNGLVIDSELSKHDRTKYYALCSSQKSFLHEHLLKGFNCKLAAGIICETINIADAIRSCKVTTASSGDLEIWDKTLKAFEDMGVDVGFLRARMERLMGLVSQLKECTEASFERSVRASEEMRALQVKLLEIRESAKRLDAEIEDLEMKSQIIEHMFQKEANAPW